MAVNLKYETWDVFTDQRFAGNPLAVVFDADALSSGMMQRLAREFDYSETVFVLNADDEAVDARVRIFTPTGELPFAGHPTVGVSCALARAWNRGGALLLELGAGRFPVRLNGGDSAYAEFENPNRPRLHESRYDAGPIELALRLPEGSVFRDEFAPRRAGAGVDFVYARVEAQVLNAARLDTAAFEALDLGEACGIYAYATEEPAGSSFEARMFAPHLGVPEDPATGSAAAGLPAHLVAAGALLDGRHEWTIQQGVVMGRPSRIFVRLTVENGTPSSVRVGGHAVPIMRGSIEF